MANIAGAGGARSARGNTTATVGRVTVPVTDRGDGVAVVFLHDNIESRRGFDAIIDRLDPVCRCVAPDLPGFGQSNRPPSSHGADIDTQIDWFSGFLDAVGIDEPFVLVVHGIGGVMGLPWAGQHPERLRGIVCMNTPFDPPGWHRINKIWAHPVASRILGLITTKTLFKKDIGSHSPWVAEAHGDRLYENLSSPVTRDSLRSLYSAMRARDYFAAHVRPVHAALRAVPTRVLWGPEDPYISVEVAGRLSDLPEIIDGAGHFVHLECPDHVVDAIKSFI